MTAAPYPKRLIEVDLPIKEISREARKDKSVRHGHISTLHVWWARRPLAACRAVLCAALWPDPADEACPQSFREAAAQALYGFSAEVRDSKGLSKLAGKHWDRWRRLDQGTWHVSDPACWWDIRYSLLDFIVDFSQWKASTDSTFLKTARLLTAAAYRSLDGSAGKIPLVNDPFAGGGAIPLEALRVGADVHASDLNPVSTLLNRVVLEYAPAGGAALARELKAAGETIQEAAKEELAWLYPQKHPGETVIAYIWARAVKCEGPSCGRTLPLVSSFWLTRRASGRWAVTLKFNEHDGIESNTVLNPSSSDVPPPTVKRGSATCPWPGCGYSMPVASVKKQLRAQRGGARDAVLLAIVANDQAGERYYRSPTPADEIAVQEATRRLRNEISEGLSTIPHERLPPKGTLGFRVQAYGIEEFGDLHTARQALALSTIARLIRDREHSSPALAALLSLAFGRLQDLNSSLSTWADTVVGANRAQNRVSMVWDFAEAAPLAGAGGSWVGQVDWVARVVEHIGSSIPRTGAVSLAPAQQNPLPDDSVDLLATDPPYYDAFAYADLSDLFLVWLKRATANPIQRFSLPTADSLSPKEKEIVVNPAASVDGRGPKDHNWFRSQMLLALQEARRVVKPGGLGIIVFAHKATRSWEALLESVVEAGWVITGSWPIDTERPTRQRAIGSAALNSSVHLICRPRERSDGTLEEETIGDWRSILRKLPERIHEWMPRLASEGVVGADAIFSCLGPALEVFSRYARVEKANGEQVELREYLEQVWAAVAREALSMIFEDADATGLEEDARLTAMWLWTLSTSTNGSRDEDQFEAASGSVDFGIEYDAARKIAQGLGAHLEDLSHVIEIKSDNARLLNVAERTRYLFRGSEEEARRRSKRTRQMSLFEELEEIEKETFWGDSGAPSAGDTTLDRVHQAMILFAANRGEALRRFVLDEGAGRDPRFWKLAQSLAALYPIGTDERRWVEGVLSRKKSLGFG